MFLLLHQSVGMRPLEKSLEKLDDVRKKKLSEMIGVSDGGPPATFTSGLKLLYFFKFSIVYAVLSIYCLPVLFYNAQLYKTAGAVPSSGGIVASTQVTIFLLNFYITDQFYLKTAA